MIVTKLRIGDANTMMAEGGIQAADKENDSPAQHYLDVMGGGHFANVPELVEKLVMDGPECIKWLNDLGVLFDKDKDGNKLTDFISIKVRGPLAERCAEFAWKGCKLAAAGDFETIAFDDDPTRQPGFLIKATEVEFLSPRKVEETAQELEDESVREVAA